MVALSRILHSCGRPPAFLLVIAFVAMHTACATTTAPSSIEAVASAPLHQIVQALADGDVASEALVATYLARIDRIDRAGPRLQSVLSLNPNALADARRLDRERALGQRRGPLHGAPILIKDNIETADPVPTTAGSMALANNQTDRDAPLVAGLRAAGAIILGKTNLSEWANFRSGNSISGWSGLGGQVRNPYILDRSPCGSSSGSGVATAAALAAASVGTETNGSIGCPSAMNGVVGFKPTVGLVSQQHIVPISSSQDTAGPMTRTVRDAALMLTAMTNREDAVDYAASLSNDGLKGVRVGVLRFATGKNAEVRAEFDAALEVLKQAGAALVQVDGFKPSPLGNGQMKVLTVEFKATLNAYLASTPTQNAVRTLSDVIAFNEREHARELALFGQNILVDANKEPGLDDPEYKEALTRIQAATRQEGIDKLLAEHNVTILVAPSRPPAFIVDAVHGDTFGGGGAGAGWMAAIAGYPHLTVPMGFVRGLPVGISFMATAGQDEAVLQAGHAYEQLRGPFEGPKFYPSAEDVPAIKAAMARPAPSPSGS